MKNLVCQTSCPLLILLFVEGGRLCSFQHHPELVLLTGVVGCLVLCNTDSTAALHAVQMGPLSQMNQDVHSGC